MKYKITYKIDNERNIFLSNDFSRAVKFEGKQEWTGCIILEEAEETIISSVFGEKAIETLKTEKQLRNNPVHYYPVPFKNNCKKYFVLNFLFFLIGFYLFNENRRFFFVISF